MTYRGRRNQGSNRHVRHQFHSSFRRSGRHHGKHKGTTIKRYGSSRGGIRL